jgi:uncharacterized protein Yka (UPF0111/DUF47 family)
MDAQMFNKLLPKEEKYFEDFKDIISHIEEMAKITHDFFSAPTYDKDIFLKMKPLEHRCDEISSKVIKRLNKNFITPFDREDIFTLIKRIDGIGNILLGVTVRVDMYNLTEPVEGAELLTAVVVRQTKELEIALRDLKKPGPQINECKAVKDLESEADNIYRAAVKKLFVEEKDPLTIFKKKEILDMLENAADKCQATANIIIAILIKNS